MNSLARLLREHADAIVSEVTEYLVKTPGNRYAALPPEERQRRLMLGFLQLVGDIEADRKPPSHFDAFFAANTPVRVRQGFDIDDIQQTINACERVLRDLFHAQIPSPDERLAALERVYEHCEAARGATFSAAVKAHREMLHEQIAVVQSLSTPILPLYKGVIVVPLIGSVDTARAEQLMQRMLSGIAEHRAAAVIIDVTGVPSIDADVATHLVRAAQAAALLGARATVAGIGAGVARTMADRGIAFTDVTTVANLEAALEHALGQLDLAILPRPRPRPRPSRERAR